MIPGKKRCIGREVKGSDRWAKLVDGHFCLATLATMRPAEFLAQAEKYGSQQAYQRWLKAYLRNDGTFLQHIVWGADRDLGGGHYLHGAMDDRAASNYQRLISGGGLQPAAHIRGKRCCVIGCWDGTENLLLRALGAALVDGVEEVPEFAEMARLQLSAWDVPGKVEAASLYDVDIRERWEGYDLLYIPGVFYHLSDPIAALLICWALLKPGGLLAFESVAGHAPGVRTAALYLGPSLAGWNWWAPTPDAYVQMMRDAGFPDARTVELEAGRGWWVGQKQGPCPLVRNGAAGFSRPDLLSTVQELAR